MRGPLHWLPPQLCGFVAVILLMFAVMATPVVAESALSVTEPLDGMVFSAGIVRSGAPPDAPLEDVLEFRDGMFSSVMCRRYNFSDAPYWVRKDGEAIRFLAELNSPTDGRMVWQGSVVGGVMTGTMHWTRERWYWTVDVEHSITGRLQERQDVQNEPPR
jgi:hypothetical protein